MVINHINVATLNAVVDRVMDCRTVKAYNGGSRVEEPAIIEYG
jgi:hypothetical protein